MSVVGFECKPGGRVAAVHRRVGVPPLTAFMAPLCTLEGLAAAKVGKGKVTLG